MRIRTTFDNPPIPDRSMDWSAIDDDTYDGAPDSRCPVGHGATEQAAINDLLEQIDEEIAARIAYGDRDFDLYPSTEDFAVDNYNLGAAKGGLA